MHWGQLSIPSFAAILPRHAPLSLQIEGVICITGSIKPKADSRVFPALDQTHTLYLASKQRPQNRPKRL